MRAALALVAAATLLLGAGTPTPQPASIPEMPECLRAMDGTQCFGPAAMRAAYSIDAALHHGNQGKGVTIAIIDSFGSSTIRSDLHTFDQAFGLPDPQLTVAAPLGKSRSADAGWGGETTLDVEWAHAIAPAARILLLTSPVDETEGTHGLPQFLKLEKYALSHHAQIISQSWGATEDTLLDRPGRSMVSQFHAFYRQATDRGVTIIASSGDSGAGGLDLSLRHEFPYRVAQWPATDPLVLAVGGTRLIVTATSRGEIAWKGSSGGFSKVYKEPAYQRGLSPAVQRILAGRRGFPDVAYDAAHESPVVTFFQGRWHFVSGTSAGSPQWAGLIALVDSSVHHPVGDVHAVLYALSRTKQYGSDFHDILAGNIADPPGISGKQKPLHAAAGWDPATGLGSPQASSLIGDLIAHFRKAG